MRWIHYRPIVIVVLSDILQHIESVGLKLVENSERDISAL